MQHPTAQLLFYLFIGLSPTGVGQVIRINIGGGTTSPGAGVTISVSVAGGMKPAAIQWTLAYPSSSLSLIGAWTGAASTAAAKTLRCNSVAGKVTCVVAGINQAGIADGTVANLQFRAGPAAHPGSSLLRLGGAAAASGLATSIPAIGSIGSIRSVAPWISGLSCSPMSVVSGTFPACKVSLNAPALSGGAVIALGSNNAKVSMSRTVTVAAGAISAAFTATTLPITGSDQSATIAARLGSSTKSVTLTLAAPARLAAFACMPTTVSAGAPGTCTVGLDKAAASTTAVALSSNNASVAAPASVAIGAGSSSVAFSPSVSPSASDQVAVLTAIQGGISRTVALTVTSSPQLSTFSCSPKVVFSPLRAVCTAVLDKRAPSTTSVQLSSNLTGVVLPPVLAIPGGATSGTVSFAAPVVGADAALNIAGRLGSRTIPAAISLRPPPAFYLAGDVAEFVGASDGSTVHPTVAPSGWTGRLTARGTGYMGFNPVEGVSGVSFAAGGPQNANTSFIMFAGEHLGSVFKPTGELKFSMKSAYSVQEREAVAAPHYSFLFDVFDSKGRKFYFAVLANAGRLVFWYEAGGAFGSYIVPMGQEEALFGKGKTARIRLTWTGSTTSFYINDTALYTAPNTVTPLTWTSTSSMTIGSMNTGSYSFGDAVAHLEIR